MEAPVTAAIVGGVIAIVGAVVSLGYRSAREKFVINKAILAEINRLLFVLERHEEWWSKCIESKNTDYPLIPFSTDVYRQQIKKVGVIDKSVIVDVVKFYGYVGYLNDLQSVRAQYNVRAEFDEQYLKCLRTVLEDYGNAFDNA